MHKTYQIDPSRPVPQQVREIMEDYEHHFIAHKKWIRTGLLNRYSMVTHTTSGVPVVDQITLGLRRAPRWGFNRLSVHHQFVLASSESEFLSLVDQAVASWHLDDGMEMVDRGMVLVPFEKDGSARWAGFVQVVLRDNSL